MQYPAMQKYITLLIFIYVHSNLFSISYLSKVSPAPKPNVYRLIVDTDYLPKKIGAPSLENAMLRGDENMYFDLRRNGLNPTNDDWLSVLQYKRFQHRALFVKAYNALRIHPDLTMPPYLADYYCGFSSFSDYDHYDYNGARSALPKYITRYITKRLWMQTSQGNYSVSKKLRAWYLGCRNNKIIPSSETETHF